MTVIRIRLRELLKSSDRPEWKEESKKQLFAHSYQDHEFALTCEEEKKMQFNQGLKEELDRVSHNPMKRLKRQLDLLQVTSPDASNNLSHNSDRSP